MKRIVVTFAGVTIAEWGYVTALLVLALRQGGAFAVSLVGLRLFFSAASSFTSVAIVHRRPGRRVLTEIAAVRTVLVAVSAVLAAVGAPLAPLFVLLALDALVSAQYRPAQAALITSLARTPRELVASATGISTIKTLGQSLGAILGGVILEVSSPAVVFAGAAIVFLCCAVATLEFRTAGTVAVEGTGAPGALELMSDSLKAVRHPHIGGILVVSGLRTFVRGMWIAIAVIASIKLLHAGSAGFGLLMLAVGIGSLAAAPLSTMLVTRSRLGTPAAIALIACGIPLAVIAGVPVFGLALALVAAWGIGMAVADVATLSLLWRLLEAPLVPRVTATIESAKLLLEGLGAFLAPLLVIYIGIRGALLFAALPLPIVVAVGWTLLYQVDDKAEQRAKTLSLCHGVHCLEPLDMASLDGLVSRIHRIDIGEGGVDVVRQGDPGDCFYIIESGTAQVLVDGHFVGQLGPGTSFGERALLRSVPRTATVRSTEPMELLSLSRQDFLAAVGEQQVAAASTGTPGPPGASDLTRRRRIEILSHLNLLSHLDAKAIGELADRSVIDRWPEGASIVRQGDEGDRFFVLLDGRATVSVDSHPVSELLPGDQFGEIALLHGVPRSADVIASSPVVTLSLTRDDFMPAVRSRMLLG
jgi:CRP-like cAMP-binding protein/predicted MFS family arabinose efflux permease